MNCKRKRASNFTVPEKELLVELVYEKRAIIENKKTDAVSLRFKETAWEEIAERFNSQNETFRTMESLKSLWDNLKKKARRSQAEIKKKSYKPGEVICDSKSDYFFERVKDVLRISLDGLNTTLDSDVNYNEGLDTELQILYGAGGGDDDEEEEEEEEEEIITGDIPNKWGNWSSGLLKMPIATVLKEHKEQSSQPYKASNKLGVHSPDANHEEHSQHTQNNQDAQDSEATNLSNPGTSSIAIHSAPTILNLQSSGHYTPHHNRNKIKNSSNKRFMTERNQIAILLQHKIDLAIMAKEHAKAEEKRKSELHTLNVKEKELNCQVAKLEAQEKRLKIAALKFNLALKNIESSSEE